MPVRRGRSARRSERGRRPRSPGRGRSSRWRWRTRLRRDRESALPHDRGLVPRPVGGSGCRRRRAGHARRRVQPGRLLRQRRHGGDSVSKSATRPTVLRIKQPRYQLPFQAKTHTWSVPVTVRGAPSDCHHFAAGGSHASRRGLRRRDPTNDVGLPREPHRAARSDRVCGGWFACARIESRPDAGAGRQSRLTQVTGCNARRAGPSADRNITHGHVFTVRPPRPAGVCRVRTRQGIRCPTSRGCRRASCSARPSHPASSATTARHRSPASAAPPRC